MALKPLVLVDFLSSASTTTASSKRTSLTSRDINSVRPTSKVVPTVDISASFTPARVKLAPGSPSRLPVRSSQTRSDKSPATPVHVIRRPAFPAAVESPSSPSRIPMKVAISRGFDRLMGRKDRAAHAGIDRGVATSGVAKTTPVRADSCTAKLASSLIAVAEANDKGSFDSSPRASKTTEVKTVTSKVADQISQSSVSIRNVASGLQRDALVQKVTIPESATAQIAPLSIRKLSPLVDTKAHAIHKQDEEDVSKITSSFPRPPGGLPSVSKPGKRVAQSADVYIPTGHSSSSRCEPSESTFDSPGADPFAHGGTTSFYSSIPETATTPLTSRSIPSADGSVAPLAISRKRSCPRTISSRPLTSLSAPLHPRCAADSLASQLPHDVHTTKQVDTLAFADLIADIHQLLGPDEHRPALDAGTLPDSPTIGTYERGANIKPFLNGHKFAYPLISLATASKTPTITHRIEDFEDFEARMNSSSNPLPVTVAHAYGNTTIPLGDALELRQAAKAKGESGNLWSLVTPAYFRGIAGRSRALKSETQSSNIPTPSPLGQRHSQHSKGRSRVRLPTQFEEEEWCSTSNTSPKSDGEIDIDSDSPLSRLVASFESEAKPTPSPTRSKDRPRLARVTSHLTSSRTIKLPRLSPHYVESVGLSQKTTVTANRVLRESNANIPVSARRCGSTVAWWTAYGAMAHGETSPDQSAKSVHVRKISVNEKENLLPLKRRSRVSRRSAC